VADTEIKKRLDELENQFAFQQQTLEALNEMVTKQWELIDTLNKKTKDMDGQLFDLQDQPGGSPASHKPPHY
jgi:SlyX protein